MTNGLTGTIGPNGGTFVRALNEPSEDAKGFGIIGDTIGAWQ
jgi:hypothetical protein